MDTLNVFSSIERATRRPEPFHSQFLADALSVSLGGDRTLFDALWRLAAPEGWDPPCNAEVKSELHTGEQRRIDICIFANDGPARRVLGLEVKTSSASAQPGQLEAYFTGLSEKFGAANVAIAYLTPFNRRRAGEAAHTLPTVRSFEAFAATVEHARHLSWLDVADIPWDGDSAWRQFQSHIRSEIASDKKRNPDMLRNRSFNVFFGEEASGRFWEQLAQIGVRPTESGAKLNLERLEVDPGVLVRALETLVVETQDTRTGRQDKFAEELREPFLNCKWRAVHEALFDMPRRFPNVWLKGKKDYALRVAHPGHGSGVSLLRSKGPAMLETGRPR